MRREDLYCLCLLAGFCLAMLSGCAGRARRVDELKSFDKSSTHLAQAEENAAAIAKGEKVPTWARARAESVIGHVRAAAQGVSESKDEYNREIKRGQDRDKSYYSTINWIIILGGISAALGVGLMIMAIVNGGKIAGGIGLLATGASLALVFMVVKAASAVLTYVAAGCGIITVGGFGWFIYDRLKERRRRQEDAARQVALRIEQRATKELANTVDAIAEHVPAEIRADVVGEVVPATQTETTQALVEAAKKGD